MKKTFILLMSVLCTVNILADDVTSGIIINNTDGSAATISISKLRSIKFSDGNMILYMNDNSQQSICIDDITNITFDNIMSAIKTLTNGNIGDNTIRITDIAGNTVFKGKATDIPSHGNLPTGIYVITTNGKNYKVMIK